MNLKTIKESQTQEYSLYIFLNMKFENRLEDMIIEIRTLACMKWRLTCGGGWKGLYLQWSGGSWVYIFVKTHQIIH